MDYFQEENVDLVALVEHNRIDHIHVAVVAFANLDVRATWLVSASLDLLMDCLKTVSPEAEKVVLVAWQRQVSIEQVHRLPYR